MAKIKEIFIAQNNRRWNSVAFHTLFIHQNVRDLNSFHKLFNEKETLFIFVVKSLPNEKMVLDCLNNTLLLVFLIKRKKS